MNRVNRFQIQLQKLTLGGIRILQKSEQKNRGHDELKCTELIYI